MKKKNKFYLEKNSVWSFPERGDWYTHSANYRGNFAPQIARNIILRYTKKGDKILDPMVGAGTTLIEAKILHRSAIGYDINPRAVKLTRENINFESENSYNILAKVGDMRKLNEINNNSIDLILTHPPYLNIIKYSQGDIKEDLSNISDVNEYCCQLRKGIKEMFRVLKEDSYCSILIGDTRRKQHYIPLSYFVFKLFLQEGFVLKEDIIKVQHNCRSDKYWEKTIKNYNFLMIKHEHLYVFRKPRKDEDLSKIKYSKYNQGLQ